MELEQSQVELKSPRITGCTLKQVLKSILASTPYRVVRNKDANRFQAIEASLLCLRDRGFLPRVVLDGGAHLGAFSIATKQIFGGAKFHLIEPQLACLPLLRALCPRQGFVLHEVALAERVGAVSLSQTSTPSIRSARLQSRNL